MTNAPIRILGVDPGLRNTGWGIIECQGSRLSFVDCGRLQPDSTQAMGARLRDLHEGLMRVIADYAPHEAAVEETFVNRDPQSALKLGQARGVALAAPALAGVRGSMAGEITVRVHGTALMPSITATRARRSTGLTKWWSKPALRESTRSWAWP